MKKVLVTTVGTSLLTNRDDRPWNGWRFGNPLPDMEECVSWLKSAPPEKGSAETHTWLRLGVREEPEVHEILLIRTDTPDGEFCARALKNYLDYWRADCSEPRRVEHLGKREKSVFEAGLRNFIREVYDAVEKARLQNNYPELVATGGFKAQIAYMNLVGMLAGVPVHYIYEDFEDVVTLAPLPITWDREQFKQVDPLLRRLDSEHVAGKDVESWLKRSPWLEPIVEYAGNGTYGLSLAGEMVLKSLRVAPPPEWPPASSREPEEKTQFQKDHERPHGWEKAVDALARVACVKLIRYNGSGHRSNVSQVKPCAPDQGALDGCYFSGDKALPLLIETTAQGEAQCNLVASHLTRKLREIR